MTTPGAQERAEQLLDDLMDHRTYDRCDWDTRDEAIALVLAYRADAVAQAVQAALEDHNKDHNGPDSLYVPRLSMDAKVAQAVQGATDYNYDCKCGAVIQPVTAVRQTVPCPACGGHAALRARPTEPTGEKG